MLSWIATTGWACVLLFLGLALPAQAQIEPNIVAGTATSDWPSVGSLDTGSGTCTATLIGCRTVLTAAHCICDPAGTGAACPDGTNLLDPADYLVYFHHAGDQDPFSPSFGVFPVSDVQVAPTYQFGVSSDLALLELAFPVRGIRPAPFNTLVSPPDGTGATIVGFGTTSDVAADSGVKREGTATTGSCVPAGVPDATHVCWSSLPSTTCLGDSGGPLFADVGAGTTVAGVHSGGADLCVAGDVAYDADVFVDRTWIDSAGGADLDVTSCGDGPQVGDAQVMTDSFNGVVTTAANHTVSVAAGTKMLRVALNAELGTAPNDFDLLLRFNAPPTPGNNDCFPALLGSFEYCEIADPTPGTWHIRVDVFSGGPGEYQVEATQLPENPAPPALESGDLIVTDFSSWELMQVDATTGERWILSSQLRGSGPMLAAPEGMRVASDGALIVANLSDRSLLEVDATTGDRTVISGCTDFSCASPVGSGPDFLGPRFVAFESNGDIVITDREEPGVTAVVRVVPGSGNRSIVSGCVDAACSSVKGTGPNLDTPFGIVVDANDDIIVTDSFGLLKIDPGTGNRTVLSGCTDASCTGTIGSGPDFGRPRELEIADGDFVLADGDPDAPPFRAVFHVDAATGARTILSGCSNAACSGTIGTGPLFSEGIIGLEVEAGGDLLVSDSEQEALFRVDPSSGNRTLLSGCVDASCSSVMGAGTHFTTPLSIALPEPDAELGLAAGIVLLGVLRRWRRETRGASS
jgi:hypothetical protein